MLEKKEMVNHPQHYQFGENNQYEVIKIIDEWGLGFSLGNAVKYTDFGGVEIDLSQSDIDGLIVIDITQIFGGTKLILPAHWELKSEITSILGGVEDKRKNYSALNIAEGKTLIIRGTSVLGGIDIKSF